MMAPGWVLLQRLTARIVVASWAALRKTVIQGALPGLPSGYLT